MSGTDPGLKFWLSYVEHEGGLVDASHGGALAVLPQSLQVHLGLPETVAVTGDPEVAREDGALLLAAGHPVLDLAAEAVLAAGDVGRHALVWPKDQLPAGADLLEQARGAFPVDHGRIDLAAEPIRAYLPVIRAGAMIQYTIAGDEAFQERAECWLDADTHRELPDVQREALQSSLPTRPDTTQVLPFEYGPAVEAAHRLLSERAARRLATLDDDSRHARAAEISRTKAYYRDVLDGIERRRAGTAADRLAALDARAEATRAEQTRRLEEIRDKHQARLDITPYRLHLILVPAVVVPVDFLRGSRKYPQRLVWVWPARRFRALACPSCGADRPLVAGKLALGCQACLTKPGPPAPVSRPAPAPARATAPATGPARAPAPASASAPGVASPAGTTAGQSGASKPVGSKPVVSKPVVARSQPAASPSQARLRPSEARLRSIGEDLLFSFWRSVAASDRKLIGKLLPNSPAATAGRLFGVRGLVSSVGIPVESALEQVWGQTRDPGSNDRFVTQGKLEASRITYPVALTWRWLNGVAAVEEILPYAAFDPLLLPRAWFQTYGSVALTTAPPPRAELDAVARCLWDRVSPLEGLSLTTRCLTAWWRLDRTAAEATIESGQPPRVLAAALLRLVSWRSGHRVSTADCAARFQVTVAQIKNAEAYLQPRLQLSAQAHW